MAWNYAAILIIVFIVFIALGSMCQANVFGKDCADIGIGLVFIAIAGIAFLAAFLFVFSPMFIKRFLY